MIGGAIMALNWAMGRAGALLRIARRYPLAALAIALAGLAWWLWQGKAEAIAERDQARAEIVAQADRFEAAQRQAAIKAMAAKAATEARYQAQAERIDNDHESALRAALARADSYARAHRVRAEKDNRSSSGPGTRAESGGSESAIGSDQAPVLVAAEDVEICTVAVVRLESAQEWALRSFEQK